MGEKVGVVHQLACGSAVSTWYLETVHAKFEKAASAMHGAESVD